MAGDGIMKRGSLETWLRRQIFNERSEGRCCTILVRHHKLNAKGMSGEQVEKIEVPEGANEEWIRSALTLVEQVTLADASGVRGIQQYGLHAGFHKTDKQHEERTCEFVASIKFRVRIEEEDDEDIGGPSEPATAEGLLAQTQRHLEAVQRINALSLQTTIGVLERTVRNLAEQNSELMEGRIELVKTVEELHSMRHERDIMTEQAKVKTQMMGNLAESAMLLGPAIVNRAIGQKLLPEKASPREMTLVNLAKSMEPHQLAALQQTLKPEQFIALMELIKDVGEEEAGKQQNHEEKPL